MAGFEQDAHISLHHFRPRRDRTAGNNLRKTIVYDGLFKGWIILLTADERPIHEIPIYQKGTLYGVHGSPAHLHVRISPWLFGRTAYVAHGNVHATDKTYLPIYDGQLAVIAVVYLASECRKVHWHERTHINTGVAKPLKIPAWNLPTTHIVVNQAHLNALPRLVNQGIGNQLRQRVVFDDVRIDVYVMLGTAYRLQQTKEEVGPFSIDFHLVVLEWQRHVLIGEQLYQRLVPFGQHQIFLFGKLQHRTLGELVDASLAHHTLFARVLAEEEIKNDAHDG